MKSASDGTQSGPVEPLSGVEWLLDLVLRLWSTSMPKRAHPLLLFALLLGSICGATIFVGAAPTLKFGHDNFFALENGWRVINGLRPQLDYFSPWGPVSFLVVALGLKLAHYSPNGIGYANAVAGLVVGCWAFKLGWKRLAPIACFLLALGVALLVCSPYPLGVSPRLSSHAMFYNRYGYALVILVMLECFVPYGGAKRGSEQYLRGGSTGAALAIALFLKASFFAASLPFVVASLVFWGLNSRRLAGMLVGFLAIAMACMAYLRFDFSGVLYALQAAAGARAMTWSPMAPYYLIQTNLPSLGLAIALGTGALFLRRGARTWFDTILGPLLMALLVYLADIVLVSSNGQGGSLPLLPAFAVLVCSRVAELRAGSSPSELRGSLPFQASLLVLCGVLFVPQLASDTVGLSVAVLRKIHPPEQACGVRFDEPRLSSLILCDSPANPVGQLVANGALYTSAVNDGTALLRQYAGPADKVLTMDMQSPFPYALGWLPPRGGMASSGFNYTFSARYKPTFDRYFGDATVVMRPKHPAQSPVLIDGLFETYLPALLERYRLAAESSSWWLYRRV